MHRPGLDKSHIRATHVSQHVPAHACTFDGSVLQFSRTVGESHETYATAGMVPSSLELDSFKTNASAPCAASDHFYLVALFLCRTGIFTVNPDTM